MKLHNLILLILIFSFSIFGQELATSESGKKVLLKADGTWIYTDDPSIKAPTDSDPETAIDEVTYSAPLERKGHIIAVHDGDTCTLLVNSVTEYKLRLAGIDAPELNQPFGSLSKEYLAKRILGKNITFVYSKMDRYGRLVGKLLLDNDDINLSQIESGLAWHYKAYENEQSEADRKRYADAETAARAKYDGLWMSFTTAVAPWEYREARRKTTNKSSESTNPSQSTSSSESTTISTPSAQPVNTGGTVQVKGYYRKDGTYVRPHTRSAPGSGRRKP